MSYLREVGGGQSGRVFKFTHISYRCGPQSWLHGYKPKPSPLTQCISFQGVTSRVHQPHPAGCGSRLEVG